LVEATLKRFFPGQFRHSTSKRISGGSLVSLLWVRPKALIRLGSALQPNSEGVRCTQAGLAVRSAIRRARRCPSKTAIAVIIADGGTFPFLERLVPSQHVDLWHSPTPSGARFLYSVFLRLRIPESDGRVLPWISCNVSSLPKNDSPVWSKGFRERGLQR